MADAMQQPYSSNTLTDPLEPVLEQGPPPNKAASTGRWFGGLLCAISAAGFASLSILGKLGFDAGFSLSGMLALRFGGAAVILLLGLLIFRRDAVFPGFRLTAILFSIGAGLYALQSALYFTGLERIPASLSSLLLYLYPVFVVFLNWRLNRTPPTRVEWGAMVLALTGVALTLEPRETLRAARLSMNLPGVLAVLASAVGYASYVVISARFADRAGVIPSIAWISSGAAVSFGVGSCLTGGWDLQLSPMAPWILLGMIVFSTVMALTFLLAGIIRVGTTTASLISTLEPLFTVILAILLLDESLSGVQFLGGFLILTAAIGINLTS